MIYYTEPELLMLEQMTYIDDDVCLCGHSVCGTLADYMTNPSFASEQPKTLQDFLNFFDLTALANDTELVKTSKISGVEWANIMSYILNSEQLRNLVIDHVFFETDYEGLKKLIAICYTDGFTNTNEAIIAFRGTIATLNEWSDNVEGLVTSDTPRQIQALNYINRLPFNNLTVIGHSKGGNKAQYSAILSDKVKRAVSFDGQGFSDYFFEKYPEEVLKNAHKISCLSVSNDFVHGLMREMPLVNTRKYFTGYGIMSVVENHCSNSFFMTDSFQNLVVDVNNKVLFNEEDEKISINNINKFTVFIMENAPYEHKLLFRNLIANTLTTVFDKNKSNDASQTLTVLLSNSNTLALLIGYIIKFSDVYNFKGHEIDEMLVSLGVGSLNSVFKSLGLPSNKIININYSYLVNALLSELKDGKNDPVLQMVFWLLLNHFHITLDSKAFLKTIESTYNSIQVVQPRDITQLFANISVNTKDYSVNALNNLFENISSPKSASFASKTRLLLAAVTLSFNKLKGLKLPSINTATTYPEARKIFEQKYVIDKQYASKIDSINESVSILNDEILKYSKSI